MKRNKIKAIFFKIIDKNLFDIYEKIKETENNIEQQEGGKYNKLAHVLTKLPDVSKYEINKKREVCDFNNSKETCSHNPHCHWSYDECHFAIDRENIIKFVNKISEELAEDDHKAA